MEDMKVVYKPEGSQHPLAIDAIFIIKILAAVRGPSVSSQAFGAQSSEEAFISSFWRGGPEKTGLSPGASPSFSTRVLPRLPGAPGAQAGVTQVCALCWMPQVPTGSSALSCRHPRGLEPDHRVLELIQFGKNIFCL